MEKKSEILPSGKGADDFIWDFINGRFGEKKNDLESRRKIKELYGEKFLGNFEKCIQRIENAEMRSKKYLQALISSVYLLYFVKFIL